MYKIPLRFIQSSLLETPRRKKISPNNSSRSLCHPFILVHTRLIQISRKEQLSPATISPVMTVSWYVITLFSLPERLTRLLQDTHEALRQLQKQVAYLQKKDEERDEKEEKILECEVFSRIAQGMWVSQVT
jgi:hypothetical protein